MNFVESGGIDPLDLNVPHSPEEDNSIHEKGEAEEIENELDYDTEKVDVGSIERTNNARYDLSEADIQQLVNELLTQKSVEAIPQKFGAFVFDGKNQLANLGRYVESTVFFESFNNTPEEMVTEYGPYDNSSLFIVILDYQTRKPIGVMRVIYNSEVGLKTINDIQSNWQMPIDQTIEHNLLNLESTWDIATTAVAREARGAHGSRMVAPALYHSLYALSKNRDIEDWVAIIDDPVLKYFQRIGLVFKQMPDLDSRPYLGSAGSTPAIAHVSELASQLQAVSAYNYQIYGEGKGLSENFTFDEQIEPSP